MTVSFIKICHSWSATKNTFSIKYFDTQLYFFFADARSPQEASTDRNSTEQLPPRNNGPTAALNKTQASLNLASNERTFNDTSGLVESNKGENGMPPLTEVNITENISQWNESSVS